MIVEDYIMLWAEKEPDKTAIICGGNSISYYELLHEIRVKANEYKNLYSPKQIVPIKTEQNIDFLVTYFALHSIGCVCAPLERNTPETLFQQLSQQLTSYQAPDNAADILYTTGTTGKSKGAIRSHATILADAEDLIEAQEFSHDLNFIITGPLNHIASLSKIAPSVMVGATITILEGMKDINAFYDAFNHPAQKFATFLVPASIRILLQFSKERLSEVSNKIDFIETGSAAISQDDMKKLCEILPNSRLYNTYASTETGIMTTYNFNDGQHLAGCVGKTMKHSNIHISDDGHIICNGATIMLGYIGDSELTSKILINGEIHTSDLGTIDSNGMLYLQGRNDDIINVGGFKITPLEVENAALSHDNILDCICISTPHPITGNVLKLLVVTKNAVFNKKELAFYLKTKLEPYKVPLQYEQVQCIKRTYNGKLDRKYYK